MARHKTVAIIANPTSGRGRARKMAETVAQLLHRHGRQVTISYTEKRGDAERLTLAACRAEDEAPMCIVACGGDGTVQEIAHTLANARQELGGAIPPIGLAPSGRCNDFARAMKITTDPEFIARVIEDQHTQDVDLGCVNGRHFCTVATMGVDARVSDFVDRMRLPLRGTVAYVYGALRVLLRYRATHVCLQGEFGTVEKAVFLASTANTSSYGGAIHIAPDAVPTDGRLDLCVIDKVSRLKSFAMLVIVLLGRHTRRPEVHFLSTKRFTLTTPNPEDLWADGERIATTPATIEIHPRAIKVLVPRT